MKRKLREDLENLTNNDARIIGHDQYFAIWDILTYSGAQEFVRVTTNDPAGEAYVHDEDTFNNNINENQHLYFFTENNTNIVHAGVVMATGGNMYDIQVSNSQYGASCTLRANFMFKDTLAADNLITYPLFDHLPLYLLPNLHTNLESEYGCLIGDGGQLLAYLPNFTGRYTDTLDLNSIDVEITSLADTTFKFCHPDTLILNEPVEDYVTSDQLEGISEVQNADGITLHSERDIEDIDDEDDEEDSEEEAETETEQKVPAEELYRYKKTKKGIVITGVKYKYIKGRDGVELNIPETLDGQPVVEIGSYAFFDLYNVYSINVPESVKLIQQGAFAVSSRSRYSCLYVKVPRKCIIGKYNFSDVDYIRY